MLVGATYNTASGIVMSYNITETPDEAANLQKGLTALGNPIAPGQAIAVIDGATLPARFTLDDIITQIQKQLALTLSRPVAHAVVDPLTNVVVDNFVGDAAHYSPPGKLAFATPVAGIGWIYDPLAKTLTSPPSTDPKTGQPVAQTTVSVSTVSVAPAA